MNSKLKLATLVMLLGLTVPTNVDAKQVDVKANAVKENNEQISYANGVGKSNPTDIVEIPDVQLRDAISDELGYDYDSNITVADMESLGMLYAPYQGIENISGLEYAKNLSTLMLSSNQVENIDALSGLTNLVSLDISNNKVSDVSSLDKLVNITNANLSNNQINNIDSLSSWNNVYDLNLSNNNLTNINALSNISALSILNIENNQINELPIFNDSSMLQTLKMSGNEIDSLENIEKSEVPMLSCVRIEENHISDLRPISKLMSAINCPPDGAKIIGQKQSIFLDKIEVNENQEITYDVYNRDGDVQKVVLATSLNPGVNKLTGDWLMDFDQLMKSDFSGTVSQEVFYNVLSAETKMKTEEEKTLTDEELLDLFKVKSTVSSAITVDQSNVNYSVPGEYKVEFSQNDSSGNLIGNKTVTLVVEDLLPEISTDKDELSIALGTKKLDYIKEYGVIASEIVENDLTDKIIVDDSNVDYAKTGKYHVTLSVSDEEKNSTQKEIMLNITRNLTTPTNPLTPEVDVKHPDNPDTLTPEIDVKHPDNPDTLTPEIDVKHPDNPDTLTPEIDVKHPDNPDTLTPEIDVKHPDNPDTLTPEVDPINPEKPEVVAPINPEKPEVVDPIKPEKPEVVDPINPEKPEEVDPINPEKPEEVDPINPEKPEEVDPINPEKPEVVDPMEPEIEEHKNQTDESKTSKANQSMKKLDNSAKTNIVDNVEKNKKKLKNTASELPIIGLVLSSVMFGGLYIIRKIVLKS